MKNIKNIILSIFLVVTVMCATSFADSNAEVNDVNAVGNANNNQTFEASDRAFPNQGGVGYGIMPGYFGDNNKPGHQFISLSKLMMYNTAWKIKDNYPETCKINLNLTIHKAEVAKEDRSKVVICTKKMFDTEKYGVTLLAVGTVNATNKKMISSALLDKVLYEASKYGATHVQFLGEGTNTELSSGGWGIGLAYTKASDTSVSSGGTGFSTGWAGYHNLPWQQFFFLKVVEPNAVAEGTVEITDGTEVDSTTVVDAQVDKAVKNSVVQ